MKRGPRHAVYWAPARSHPLWAAGCDWLGSDAESGATTTPGHADTATPRRYGFHATLKAPMRLAEGVDDALLLDAVARIATTTAAFAMPPLRVATLGTFVALRPVSAVDAAHPLRRLADRCVLELDALRRPFTNEEAHARREGLDAAAIERLERHGYQHVLDGWRFHMTLTDSFADLAIAQRTAGSAREHFRPSLTVPLPSDHLAIFTEHESGGAFALTARIPLSG